MTTEIIKELTSTEDNSNVTSEQVLMWANRIEADKSHTSMLESVKGNIF